MLTQSDFQTKIRPRTLLLVLVLMMGFIASSVDARNFDNPNTEVWITIDLKGFELIEEAGIQFRGEAIRVLEESGGVIITRVHTGDLPRISAQMHVALHRCAGFMVHEDLSGARKAVSAASRERVASRMAYSINQGTAVQTLTAAIDKPEILNTIERLSVDFNNRYHQHPSGTAAAQWIQSQWAGYASGRSDVTVELYPHLGINQPSVILTIQGSGLPDEFVILGAHLDSVAPGTGNPFFVAPGADDDASGIAVLSEVVRVAMTTGFRPHRTVQFMGYAAEEIGLVGSSDIATQYSDDGVNVVAVLQFDMTDYNGSVEDIGILGDHTDSTLSGFVNDLIATYQPALLTTPTTCGYGCSDHASWDNEGFPVAMAAESIVGEHNPQLHTVDDTLANLGNSVDHAFKFANLGVAFMVELAKEGEAILFGDGFEGGSTGGWSGTVP